MSIFGPSENFVFLIFLLISRSVNAVSEPEYVPPGHPDLDDMLFTPSQLEALKSQGVDTSDFAARGVYARKREWSEKDENGVIVVPWSVTSGYPYEAETEIFMEQFSKAVEPCMRTQKVERDDLATTEWENGIIFGWEIGSGCWSYVGVAPGGGLLWGSRVTVPDSGAPDTWQLIHMSENQSSENVYS